MGVLATIPDAVGIVKDDDSWAVPKPVKVAVPASSTPKPLDTGVTEPVPLIVKVELVCAGNRAPRRTSGNAILIIYY
jgi:hypothetical protein